MSRFISAAIILIFNLSLLLAVPTAQGKVDSKIMDLRNKIEREVNRNITELMLTRLDPKAFNVASRVQVIETPDEPPKPPPPNKEPEGLPAGMDLGPIDVRELLESYKKQIEQLKLQKEKIVEKTEQKYTVTKIEVIVGLDESFSDQYVKEFQAWLQKRVAYDYGNSATSSTNKIKLLKPPPIPDPHSWWELLPLIGYALLGLFTLFAAIFLGRGLRRLGEGSKNIIIEHKNPLELEGQKTEAEPNEEDFKPLPVRAERVLDYDILVGKIALLSMELGDLLSQVVRVWLESGNDGFTKAAIFIDTIVGIRERIFAAKGVDCKIPVPLDQDLAKSHEENLSEAYRLISQINENDRLHYLDEIYWDLVSLKTLGAQSLRRPFDFLQSMNDFAFVELLKTQSKDQRALALIYSAPERAVTFLSNVNDEEKENVLIDMCNTSKISNRQIWDLDTAMKLNLLNQSASPESNLVDLLPRTVEVLQNLGTLEEIFLLRRIVIGLKDFGLSIKQQFTSLAFLDEWNQDYVAKLVSVASSTELVHLCHMIPETRPMILRAVPERMKMIIEDDLGMSRPEDVALAKSLKALKQKWINISLAEAIPMTKVISYRSKETGTTETEYSHAA